MAIEPLIVPLVLPVALWAVVAPHGVTDILDAAKRRNISELAVCYGSAFVTCEAFETAHLYNILLLLGLLLSIWHLRWDLGGLFMSLSIHMFLVLVGLFDLRTAFAIMTFLLAAIHVPGHYRRKAHLITTRPLESTMVLAISTASGLLQSANTELELTSPLLAITAGHILFTELKAPVEEP
mmetsp:Transcript_67630/g.188719  ORF Transcript_67630/g.188719 Transcript_67630/m.188719 type:complete len:181 (+) Transcript_67630:89-631(+)